MAMQNSGAERYWRSVRVEFEDEKIPMTLLSGKTMSVLYVGKVYKCDSYIKILYYRDYFCICLRSYGYPCVEFMPFKWFITGKHHHLLGEGYMKGVHSHLTSYASRILNVVRELYKACKTVSGANFVEKRRTLFEKYIHAGSYLHSSVFEFLCVVCMYPTSVTTLVNY